MQSIGTIQRSCLTSSQRQDLKGRQRRTKVAKIYYFVSGIHFHLIGIPKCIGCPRIFKHEMVHKDKIFTSCFNFDLNRSASKTKKGSKMSILKPCQKHPPLVNDNEQGPSGGPREKLTAFLLRGRMIFCYHVNRLLTVSLLSEIFT